MKTVILVGMGKSNIAVLKYLNKKKYKVFTYDGKEKADYNFERINKEHPIFDIAFISPGIYLNSKTYSLISNCSLSITSEISYALAKVNKKVHVIGVTGSNGKTTTVLILYKLLTSLGNKCLVVGNIGVPLIDKLKSINSYDYLIVEISSFQAFYFSSNVLSSLIITSFSFNHLDAYNFESEYLLSKKRLIKCADNVYTNIETKEKMNLNENIRMVDTKDELGEEKDYLYAKALLIDLGYKEKDIDNIDYSSILPKCRYEEFFKLGNTIFIDDSKSTSLGATSEALKKSNEDTTLILGGHLKSSISHILDAKRIMIYGRENKNFLPYVSKAELYESLDDVINDLKIDSFKKERILFSPGGSSIYFDNYLVRGKEFKNKIFKKFRS